MNISAQVEKTFRAPGFQQDLYYILMGIIGFMLNSIKGIFTSIKQDLYYTTSSLVFNNI